MGESKRYKRKGWLLTLTMIISKQSDTKHKYQIIKLLTAVLDNEYISQFIAFKGGTCAEMSGFLDRFSIDLDFDIRKVIDKNKFQLFINKIADNLNLKTQNKDVESLFYSFKYEAPENQRNTLKISFYENPPKSNDYEFRFLPDVNRLVNCQTLETMFANKLVAPIDRFNRHKKVVGRDIYDIYYFFSQGYHFKPEIIEERTGLKTNDYLKKLTGFIEDHLTDKVISEDLSTLLPYNKFNKIRRILKKEVLIYLHASI